MMLKELHEIADRLTLWESRFAHALEAAEVGIWEWNLVTDNLYWDDRMFKIFKVDKSHFTGRYSDFAACVHPDDLKALEKQIKDCIDYNVPYVYFFRVKDPANPTGWKYIKGKGKVFRDETGKAVSMSGVNLVSDCPDEFLKTFQPPNKDQTT